MNILTSTSSRSSSYESEEENNGEITGSPLMGRSTTLKNEETPSKKIVLTTLPLQETTYMKSYSPPLPHREISKAPLQRSLTPPAKKSEEKKPLLSKELSQSSSNLNKYNLISQKIILPSNVLGEKLDPLSTSDTLNNRPKKESSKRFSKKIFFSKELRRSSSRAPLDYNESEKIIVPNPLYTPKTNENEKEKKKPRKIVLFQSNHEKEITKIIKDCENLKFQFNKGFDCVHPISKVNYEAVRDTFRFFFNTTLTETTPFFFLNDIPLKLPKTPISSENFLEWLLGSLNSKLAPFSELSSLQQAQLICNGPKESAFCKLIPCYPILQSLSFSAFSTAALHLRLKHCPDLFSNIKGELNMKNFPTSPTCFSIDITASNGNYKATQIKTYCFFIVGETEQEHKFQGSIEVHWTVYGTISNEVRQACLHFHQLQFDKSAKLKMKRQILEKFGLFNL